MEVFEATLEARICKLLREEDRGVMLTFSSKDAIQHAVQKFTPIICKEIQLASKRVKKQVRLCEACGGGGELDCAHSIARPVLCYQGLEGCLNVSFGNTLSMSRVIAAMLQKHLGIDHYILCKPCHRRLDGNKPEEKQLVLDQIRSRRQRECLLTPSLI